MSARLEAVADAAFALAEAAIARGDLPGAALAIVTAAGDTAIRHAGHAVLVPAPEALTRDHWFDLASLTKVMVTTPAILALADAGRLDLDAPIATAIPDLRQYDVANAPERRLTFRDLLAHRTFLPAVEPIYTVTTDPATARAYVLQREWRHGLPVYSDINFILLGIAIERLTGSPLSALSLGDGLSFAPVPGPAVATEACTWRGRVMQGEVHDENAYALGGAPGHAGLFGTIEGVAGFARRMLAGEGFSPAALAAMRSRVHLHRSCGWEVAHDGWHGGNVCSADSIGHTGFTGTGLWIDFARGIGWALLTNRVHPTRHRESGIFTLRPAVGDAVTRGWHG